MNLCLRVLVSFLCCLNFVCSADVGDVPWPPFSLFEESGSGEPTDPPPSTPGPPTSAPSTTVEVLNCQNGGTFNGTVCLCPASHSGNLCQYLQNFEPETYSRSAKVEATIEQEYHEDFDNTESEAYKTFAETFSTAMLPYYRKSISSVEKVVVLRISKAVTWFGLQTSQTVQELSVDDRRTKPSSSVVVDHEVIVQVPNTVSSVETFEEQMMNLTSAAKQLVNCKETVGPDCPYVAVTEPTVTQEPLQPDAFCKADSEFAAYYQFHEEDGKLMCLTPCDSRHKQPKTCYNRGTCNMSPSTGPYCSCLHMDSTWYLGDSCSHPIKRHAFYTGLSVTLVCLLATVGGLAVYVVLSRRRQRQRKDVKEKLVKEWLNEDFEWSRSNSAANTHTEADAVPRSNTLSRPPQIPRVAVRSGSAATARAFNSPSSHTMVRT